MPGSKRHFPTPCSFARGDVDASELRLQNSSSHNLSAHEPRLRLALNVTDGSRQGIHDRQAYKIII
jgi:hypothetical protein